MRKVTSLLVLIALLAFGLTSAIAQDTPGTIADIVVASAGAETPEFTTLLTAVQAADPGVLAALSDPEAEFTVFAPTDAAFAAAFEALGTEAVTALLADPAALANILYFHVLPGKVMSADVVAALEAGEGKFSAQTANGQWIDITQDESGAIFINGAELNLGMLDIEASNGVIHVINSVILPESRTIAEIVVESAGNMEAPEFSTLLAAVLAADPAVVETLGDAEAELTVFAPTDAAFAALAAALGEEAFNGVLADQAALTNILLYHVIADKVYSSDVAALLESNMGSFEAEMANGAMAKVEATEDGLFIAGAKIIATDIDAANGVIHVIDAVMLPPAE